VSWVTFKGNNLASLPTTNDSPLNLTFKGNIVELSQNVASIYKQQLTITLATPSNTRYIS
jgi:hypothetical protein